MQFHKPFTLLIDTLLAVLSLLLYWLFNMYNLNIFCIPEFPYFFWQYLKHWFYTIVGTSRLGRSWYVLLHKMHLHLSYMHKLMPYILYSSHTNKVHATSNLWLQVMIFTSLPCLYEEVQHTQWYHMLTNYNSYNY